MRWTFSCTSERLPTNAQVTSHIYTDRQWVEAGEFDREKHLLTMLVRESYVEQSFVLLTDEFIISLQRLCTDFASIVEIGAGIGWLGYWLCKYGISKGMIYRKELTWRSPTSDVSLFKLPDWKGTSFNLSVF